MNISSIIGTIIGLVLGNGLAILVIIFIERRAKKKRAEKQNKLSQLYSEKLTNNYKDVVTKYFIDTNSFANNRLFSELYDYLSKEWHNDIPEFPRNTTKTDVEKMIEERTEALRKRLEAIEQRFPKESTIDKIASVNDAILATKLEQLTTSIKVLNDKQLNEWDVVKIVFAVLAAIGVIIAMIFGIIALVK